MQICSARRLREIARNLKTCTGIGRESSPLAGVAGPSTRGGQDGHASRNMPPEGGGARIGQSEFFLWCCQRFCKWSVGRQQSQELGAAKAADRTANTTPTSPEPASPSGEELPASARRAQDLSIVALVCFENWGVCGGGR